VAETRTGASTPASSSGAPAAPRAVRRNPIPFMIAAWLVPGLGHLLLGRRRLAGAFLVLVGVCLATGLLLEGELWAFGTGSPLNTLAALAEAGLGVGWLALKLTGYQGDNTAAGYEYGTAFLLTAALMNLLLVLDVFDLATGRKGFGAEEESRPAASDEGAKAKEAER
jgi:hypothetical protein